VRLLLLCAVKQNVSATHPIQRRRVGEIEGSRSGKCCVITGAIRQHWLQQWRANWAEATRRVRFDSWLCGNQADREELAAMDLVAGQALGAEVQVAGGIGARLQWSGPAGPYTDLAQVGTPRAQRLTLCKGRR
jgi:hypothetical protein